MMMEVQQPGVVSAILSNTKQKIASHLATNVANQDTETGIVQIQQLLREVDLKPETMTGKATGPNLRKITI